MLVPTGESMRALRATKYAGLAAGVGLGAVAMRRGWLDDEQGNARPVVYGVPIAIGVGAMGFLVAEGIRMQRPRTEYVVDAIEAISSRSNHFLSSAARHTAMFAATGLIGAAVGVMVSNSPHAKHATQ